MDTSALALRPLDFFRLLDDAGFIFAPPPLPRGPYNSLGATRDAIAPLVPPLTNFGVEQLYDEACFSPPPPPAGFANVEPIAAGYETTAAGHPTAKGELKR